MRPFTPGSTQALPLMMIAAVCLAASTAATRADAQEKPAPDAPKLPDDDGEAKAREEPSKPDKKVPDDAPPEPAREAEPIPAPPDPRPGEQSPRPYLDEPLRTEPLRNVEIGPDVGIWSRSADSDTISYGPGLAFGAHVRVNLIRYLGVRAIVTRAEHSVAIEDGLGLPDTSVDQADLRVTTLALRVEPTWAPTPHFRLWIGPEVGWTRITAPRPTTRGAFEVHGSERDGSSLELAMALGGSVDVLPNWLAVGASLRAGLAVQASGDVFDNSQAIDQNGRVVILEGLPEFFGSFAGLVNLDVIL